MALGIGACYHLDPYNIFSFHFSTFIHQFSRDANEFRQKEIEFLPLYIKNIK